MEIKLTLVEARVLGCLIEKAVTTPNYYPLSLGSLTGACNQKSSREPMMSLSETEVLSGLDGLFGKRMVSEKTPSGSRVTKYSHRLSNTLGLTYDFTAQSLGLLCLLMLRGAQTIGELRGRSGRLCEFRSLEHVEDTLASLTEREDGPYVMRLPRQAGRKESRYAHLLCGTPDVADDPEISAAPAPTHGQHSDERLTQLEEEVNRLRAEFDELKRQLGE
jgi:hypothetical protein